MNGVEKVAVVRGDDVVAMEQQGGADPDRDAVDGGDDRLGVVGQRIEKFHRVGGARRVGIRRAVLQEIFQIVAGGKYARPA